MKTLRIGTRDSQLAVWQATWVKNLLAASHIPAELVYMKSEGDIDTVTPLYALGVQGVFTKTLDAALLNNRIDIAVHSMKDVPTQLPQGIRQAAVLERASTKDILVYKHPRDLEALGFSNNTWTGIGVSNQFTVGTSSIRRIAQWLHRYPAHSVENLRGNVNTRLRKLEESHWNGAIFAAAGVERINVRPENSVDLDWMLPAPAQGAIMIVCRSDDDYAFESCIQFNHEHTDVCTRAEREFLSTLMGGCSTPISALAIVDNNEVVFKGNIVSPDGKESRNVERRAKISEALDIGKRAAETLLQGDGAGIISQFRKKDKA